jgi:hypothetical protein
LTRRNIKKHKNEKEQERKRKDIAKFEVERVKSARRGQNKDKKSIKIYKVAYHGREKI